jgi:hypothetical protein
LADAKISGCQRFVGWFYRHRKLNGNEADHDAGRVRRSCSGDFHPQVHRR